MLSKILQVLFNQKFYGVDITKIIHHNFIELMKYVKFYENSILNKQLNNISISQIKLHKWETIKSTTIIIHAIKLDCYEKQMNMSEAHVRMCKQFLPLL